MSKYHNEININELTDKDERAFFQIVEELRNYHQKLLNEWYDPAIHKKNESKGTQGKRETKQREVISLLQTLVLEYQNETGQLIYFNLNQTLYGIPLKGDGCLNKNDITGFLKYPENDDERSALKACLNKFKQQFLVGDKARNIQPSIKILATRRNPSSFITAILNILNKLSLNKFFPITGKNVGSSITEKLSESPKIC